MYIKWRISKGTITAGKLADLVELDRNPLKVAPDETKDIQVRRTIKGGKPIYVRGQWVVVVRYRTFTKF
jgi:predicted amidohydrolase YtcJ